MRQLILVALLFFCLTAAGAQTTILQKKINVELTGMTLERALGILKARYGIRFSYANNLIPLSQPVNLSARNEPLTQVLDQLLKDTDVGYRLVADQVVLRNDPDKNKNRVLDARSAYPVISRLKIITPAVVTVAVVPANPEIRIEPVAFVPPDYQETTRNRARRKLRQISGTVGEAALTVADKTTKAARAIDKNLKNLIGEKSHTVADTATGKPQVPTPEKADTSSLKKGNETGSEEKQKTAPATDTTTVETRLFQISFVPPLGTNGTRGGKIVNRLSFNILAGYAAGVNGAEFGSIANIEKGYVKGAQFSGFVNVVGGPVTGVQFAGFANIVKDSVQGAQFAGFANITKGGVTHGGQFAGFINVAKGPVSAVQAAGFINVTSGNVTGTQLAGFANITKGDVSGPQLAGFVNIASATHAQFAGFINMARKVSGIQVGIINIADSVDGVQIGLFNFSRRGYRRLEVWGSESMYANVAFKMGTQYFHNIFAVGYRTDGGRNYTAYGYGFGSHIPVSTKTSFNLDLIAWHMNVDEAWTSELNLLNQFRANIGFRLGGRTSIFAGPTFNVYVSNLYDAEKGRYGIPPTPWHVYDKTHGRTNVVMWPGFNVGLRF